MKVRRPASSGGAFFMFFPFSCAPPVPLFAVSLTRPAPSFSRFWAPPFSLRPFRKNVRPDVIPLSRPAFAPCRLPFSPPVLSVACSPIPFSFCLLFLLFPAFFLSLLFPPLLSSLPPPFFLSLLFLLPPALFLFPPPNRPPRIFPEKTFRKIKKYFTKRCLSSRKTDYI